jgi:DNA-binding protein HU-beta/integration host factor subunit alpha
MTKHDLVMRIVKATGLPQDDVARVVQGVLSAIIDALRKGDTVELRNFGVFRVKERQPRVGRNPKHPDQVVRIPRRKVVKFKPGSLMRKLVTGS